MRPPSTASGTSGTSRRSCPTHHGFDEYFGLPYSNDMWPRHPQQKDFYPDLPLIEGDQVIRRDPDQSQLTNALYRARRRLHRAEQRPAVLSLRPAQHAARAAVRIGRVQGQDRAGLYGDVIAEIDWSVGEILDAVSRAKLDENTLVIFTSDNGPWMSYGNHAGSPGPFRESKGTSFDGGVRVPFVARWPGRIPARLGQPPPGDDHRSAADAREACRGAATSHAPRRRTRPVAGPLAAARRLGPARRAVLLLGHRAARGSERPLEAAPAAPLSVVRAGGRGRSPRQVRFEKSSGCRCSTSTPIRVNRPTSPSVIRTS